MVSLPVDETDASTALLGISDDLRCFEFVLEFVPETVDPAVGIMFDFDDVMEGNETAIGDERRVPIEIVFDTIICVITIDEQEVDIALAKRFFDPSSYFGGMRVATQKHLFGFRATTDLAEEFGPSDRVATTKLPTWKIDTDVFRGVEVSIPHIITSATCGTDFTNRLGIDSGRRLGELS